MGDLYQIYNRSAHYPLVVIPLDKMTVKIEGNVPKTVQKIIFTLDDNTKKSTFFSVSGEGKP